MTSAAPAIDPNVSAAAAALTAARAAIRAKATNGTGPKLGRELTLEQLVTHQELGAFRASPTQLALIRAADGRGAEVELLQDRMKFHFGAERLPSGRPRLVVLRTGVRAGKSFLAAMGLLKSVLTCVFRREPLEHEVPDVDGLVGVRKGEFVRALIVGPVLELSKAVLYHLVGTMQASPRLAPLLVKTGSNLCIIKRPDGHKILVKLVAASSGGTNLRSTWLAGAVFDEAAFFDEEGKAVTLADQLRAALTRLLKGAQAWVPSSPWNDSDPFHQLFERHFGKPGWKSALAFHSDSRSMNPSLDREEEEAERERDPDNAAREYDAIPLPTGSALFFPMDAIKKSVNEARPMWLDPLPNVAHSAAADPGLRKNSSAVSIARFDGGKVRLVYHEELRPGRGVSLKPSETFDHIGRVVARYGCKSARGDQWYADSAHEEFERLRDEGVEVYYDEWTPRAEAFTEMCTEFRRRMQEGLIELPNDPRLLAQLKAITWKALPGGVIKVVLPKQGQTHGDLAQTVISACTMVEIPRPGSAPIDDYDINDDYRFGNRRGFG